ncbi:MAG: metalloregulator ArsR/SmtB family transcription factor [Chitinophagaceae bacterium]|nr:metalloregulator ArsR/SmtB family transcription factor [Chitinophagaceae bacterium]
MGASKTSDYSPKEIALAKYAKALSHPARVAILNLLIKRQACICGDLVDELPLSQSTVSQHLKELKEAGLIKGDIDGVSVCYCIDQKEWKKAKLQLGELFETFIENKTKCC